MAKSVLTAFDEAVLKLEIKHLHGSIVHCQGCHALIFKRPRHRKYCTPACMKRSKVRRYRAREKAKR